MEHYFLPVTFSKHSSMVGLTPSGLPVTSLFLLNVIGWHTSGSKSPCGTVSGACEILIPHHLSNAGLAVTLTGLPVNSLLCQNLTTYLKSRQSIAANLSVTTLISSLLTMRHFRLNMLGSGTLEDQYCGAWTLEGAKS